MRKLTYTIVISDDEAMVSHLSGFKQTIVFAPRHDRVSAKVIKLGGNELRGAVGTLRRGLDLTDLNRLPRSIRRKPLRSTRRYSNPLNHCCRAPAMCSSSPTGP